MALIFLFCVAVFSIYLFSKWYKIFLTGIQIPGPWTVPMMGNMQLITQLTPEKLLLQIQNYRECFGQSFRLWLGPKLWVFLHTPEENRDALLDASLRKADTFYFLDKLIGNGLLISEGTYWESHRKALGSAFHPSILNSFAVTICQHAEILVDKLLQRGDRPVEISQYLFPCIMDAIIHTSMGINLETQNNKKNPFTHAFHRTTELLFYRMTNPLLFSEFIYGKTAGCRELNQHLQTIHNSMHSIIIERQQYLNEQKFNFTPESCSSSPRKRPPQCLLDTLLTLKIAEKPLSLKEIKDEVNTFVLAGVDTTTSSMSFVVYALAEYPREQEKLFNELCKHNFQHTEHLTASDLNKLEYFDLFIKECLRYYTTVPLTGRQTTQPTRIGERTYAAGITLWINMYGLAHDSELFEDPWCFRPSRFSKDAYARVPKFSYIPFSAGPHICIGRKYAWLIMKILTVKILQKFIVTPTSGAGEKLILALEMVLKAKNGISLILLKRE